MGSAPSGASSSSDAQLRAEIDRLRKENLDLRAQLEKLSPGNTIKKPTSSTNSYVPPKTNTTPPPPKPTPPPANKPKPVQNPPPSTNKPSQTEVKIVGTYVPPSMNKSGNIFDRIEQTIKLKNDMKKTLDEIYNRLNDANKRIDNFVDKALLMVQPLKIKKRP